MARGSEASGWRPSVARRIVELRSLHRVVAVKPACDQHFAVGQQGGRMSFASGYETVSRLPVATRWILELRAREIVRKVVRSSCDQNPAVGE